MVIAIGTIVKDGKGQEYEVIEFLGAGSFGIVYKIKNKSTSDLWALKSIQTPFADQTIVKAFINEGKLATKVVHENVIQYMFFHDGSQYENLPPYIIMDLAEGGTLQQLIATQATQKKFLSMKRLLATFDPLINGMEAINAVLVHRDIKPDNILIANGKPKISDFGLSKVVTEATRNTTFKGIGCLPYMAPEAWQFEKNTILMDIYSMGIVFYEIAALKHPLTVSKGDIKSWQDAHLYQSPSRPDTINPDLSPIVSQLIMKMIDKKPANRFHKWADVRDFLGKTDIPKTDDSHLVEGVLKKRMEIDQRANEERLKAEKRSEAVKNQKVLISFQIEEEIIKPLQQFIGEINAKYIGPKARIDFKSGNMTCQIQTPSGKHLDLEVKAIFEEDFYRERIINDFGMNTRRTELQMPNYQGAPLLAWGYLKASDGRGFNLLLLKNNEELYGSWYMMINRNSALVRQERPEPFPFEFREIEREIQLVRGMHIYVSEGRALDLKYLKEFVAAYF
jgi:serine/threonine protein kinase